MAMLNVSGSTANAMLDAVAAALGGAYLELLTDSGELLVELAISDPGAAIDGVLAFELVAGVAVKTGEARFARAVAADGREVFSCDAGDENSDATIRLDSTKIYRGDAVKIKTFRLVMP